MHKFPITDLNVPKTGTFTVYCDYWWPVSEDNKIFFFGSSRSPYQSPQCNANKAVLEKIYPNSLIDEPVRHAQLPVIYVPVNWSDYV